MSPFFLQIFYSIASAYWNRYRIQKAGIKGKRKIKHWTEDFLIQLPLTILVSKWYHHISWMELLVTFSDALTFRSFGHAHVWDGVFTCIAMAFIHWFIFDPFLNHLMDKELNYRSKAWYDNILPEDFMKSSLIKLIGVIIFVSLSLI